MSTNFSNSVLHHQPGAAERVEVVNALELDLSQIELDLSEINIDLTSIETLIGTSNEKLDEVKGAIEALDLTVDLSTLESTTGEIKTELEAANVALGEIKTAVEGLELSVDLSQLETTTGEIKTELESANVALGEIKGAVEALELDVDLSTLEGDVAAIKGGLEPLTDKETGISVTSSETAVVEVSIAGRSTVTAWIVNTGLTNGLEYKFIRYADATTDFSRVIVDWSALSANSAAVPIDIIAFPGRYVIELRSADGTTANAALQAGG
jgi:predicted  nucleic acid-binding Zn-ribbon protein